MPPRNIGFGCQMLTPPPAASVKNCAAESKASLFLKSMIPLIDRHLILSSSQHKPFDLCAEEGPIGRVWARANAKEKSLAQAA